ncbi:MAG: epoxyqueuosine reductase, partial [Reinekea sp.]
TEGSAIRRIGYEQWQRNIAIALGNGQLSTQVTDALTKQKGLVSELVDEHIDWALSQLKVNHLGQPATK